MKYNFNKRNGVIGAIFQFTGLIIFIGGIFQHDWFYLIGGALLATEWTRFEVIHYHDGYED